VPTHIFYKSSLASCLFAGLLELNFGQLSSHTLMLWHWAGSYLPILLHHGYSPFLLLSYLSQPEKSFHSSSVLGCISLTSSETIVDYAQLRVHSPTSLAVLVSSGAPLPQFCCGLSFVQLLLRSYRGLRFSALSSPRCFPPDSIRANLDNLQFSSTLFTSCSQSHSHLSSLSQIWSIVILMIDSQRPVGSFG